LTIFTVLLRTLPDHYTADSTFTWFALMTPGDMQKNLTKLGIAEKYTYERPGVVPPTHVVESFTAIKAILNDNTSFSSPYATRAKDVMEGKG